MKSVFVCEAGPKRILFSLLIFQFYAGSQVIAANLRLPAIIQNHMVIQQQSSVTFWGWAKAGDSVRIKADWCDEAGLCMANSDGKWRLNVSTFNAGGPFNVKIQADTTIIIEDVMIGEVWVCGGQSNMQMPFNGFVSMPVLNSNDYIAHGRNDNIRLFTVERNFSVSPVEDCKGRWVVSNPFEVAKYSAVAYAFGKYLQEILGIPVGLIHSSWGGTPIESWIDEHTLNSEFGEIDFPDLKTDKVSQETPGVLFNGMIFPILNYAIRGVIWYQGESNRKHPKQYSFLFPSMIQDWRRKWNVGDFPFYFVQIAPYSYRHDSNTQSAFLREAQLKTMLKIENTGMAVTIDIGDSLSNHPAEKVTVGKRLAYWALAKTYHMTGLSYSGPVFKAITIKENKAILTFDYAEYGLTSFGKELHDFVIAGNDRQFYPAKAEIKGTTLEIWSDKVSDPVAVRYCWKNFVVGTLYNNAGIPASSFRTDNWDY
ncbi:MAG: sialate O-acetylesterase [Mangrovibacterium sp.]